MKIILSGGGTGGHVYPAIAIADALKQHDPATDILFVGASDKMEMQKVPEAGYPIAGLGIRGFQRKQVLQNASLPFRLLSSLWESKKLLNDFSPDVVVGTGGYVSAPILYMASKKRIPTLIQEQNAVVGLTNKILAKYVDTVCVAYEDVKAYLPRRKTVLTGNPVRESLTHLNEKKKIAHAYFTLVPSKKCLLVLGGSLGSKTINESILQAVEPLCDAGLQIIWATGHLAFEAIKAQLTQRQKNNVKAFPFIKAMDLAYAAADIVVSRGGALTIAELCIVQKPVIFVPSPHVTADHQTKNVWPLVEENAALLVKDNEAMQTLPQKILHLLQLETLQNMLARNMKNWAKPHATATIVQEIIRLTKV